MPAPTHAAHSENATGSSRRKKIKAILASGTVLGIGAVVTMATWNDSQFAEGNFTAGEYDVVSSADDVTYTDHGESNVAELTFGAANAAPDDKYVASLWLQTTSTSSYAGEIEAITAPTSAGQTENYTVKVRQLERDAECTTETTAGSEIATGTDLTELSEVQQSIEFGNDSGTTDQTTQLCFQVTASENLISSESASVTWEVQTASASAPASASAN
ncbi:SipW-dependent-type signal peptide-containing protein [Nesterenkonia lutea]|uniref:Ribosomally synthesized peptide with SipW-like signal peptide n=1 Tax=Nesterenkonia lutea TaxID=272919 RepID=A0ABR9JGJ4_9MICC|nr:SipW-dependent-type signal peptide-containing protein [Nesterenkonia lutea]MBE1524893.1 putative ribosomally synthesized peptide with SipW-like signal peptide [Nesterenkonia lutea]